MAVLKTQYFQDLKIAPNGAYKVDHSAQPGTQYTLEKKGDPSAETFEAGDIILLYTKDLSTVVEYTYMGSYAGGIVLQGLNSAGQITGPFLFTNYPIPTNTTFTPDTTTPYPVCFVRGTQIVTSRGLVAIENLVPGDRVQGSTGWRTVKWIGFRHYGASALKTEESKHRIAPVRIRADAIADHVPSSDLYVSAWHHLFVQGKLVRAGDLVNGTTITQETTVTEVSYYHVELDQFDIIMAHGIYSESWADGGNRSFFQNADIASLRPEDMLRRRAPRPGFDHLVVRKGKALFAIQEQINERAKTCMSVQSADQKVA